jgi:exopolysaccharide production protein ExoQ
MFKKLFSSLEYVFVIISLILYTDGFITLLLSDGFSEGEKNESQAMAADNFVVTKLIFTFTYAIAAFLLTTIVSRDSKLSSIFFRNITVLPIVGWAMLSVFWSELPDITISRSVALLGSTIFGIYLANRYTIRQQIILLSHVFLSIIFLSIVFAIVLPQYGVMSAIHDGAWRGIYSHKNEMGRIMVLSTIIFAMQIGRWSKSQPFEAEDNPLQQQNLYLPGEGNGYSFIAKLLAYLGFCLSISLLVLSKSSSSIVNSIVLLSLLVILRITQLSFYQRAVAILAMVFVFGSAAIAVVPEPDVLFASFGKGSDLSGRSFLWDIILDTLSENPFLGFGYSTFWLQHSSKIAPYNGGWAPPHAHNGFLDLTLSIGIIGLTLFAISYLYTLVKSIDRFRYHETNDRAWPLVMLGYITASNMTESGLFAYNGIFWVLYVTVSYSVIYRPQKRVFQLPPAPSTQPLLALKPSQERTALPSADNRSGLLPPTTNPHLKSLPPQRDRKSP